MRWFKHLSDTRNNPKIRQIEKRLGEAGYARAFKLVEVVSNYCGTGDKFNPRIKLGVPPYDLDWLAEELRIPTEDAKQSLAVFAEFTFIDPVAWRDNIVHIPQILEYRDEYSDRMHRIKTRREQVPINSRLTLDRVPPDVEGKANTETEGETTSPLPPVQEGTEPWKGSTLQRTNVPQEFCKAKETVERGSKKQTESSTEIVYA